MKVGSEYYFYQNDHLGTPQKLTIVSGALVWSAKYSSFGKAQVDSASTVVNNLRLAGQYFDSESGLHYNFYRYYESELGRYLETDPAKFSAGINFYTYVQNNPLKKYDPFGLLECDIRAALNVVQEYIDMIKEIELDKNDIEIHDKIVVDLTGRDIGENSNILRRLRLNKNYLNVLNVTNARDLLDTVIHEVIHYNDPWYKRWYDGTFNQKHPDVYADAKHLTDMLFNRFNDERKALCLCNVVNTPGRPNR